MDHLFRKYQPTKQIQELKVEILSNLEAKVADLTASGMAYRDAVQQVKDSIRSIDNWIYLFVMWVTGIALPFFNTPSMVLLQENVEEDFLGRVFGIFIMLSSSMMRWCSARWRTW